MVLISVCLCKCHDGQGEGQIREGAFSVSVDEFFVDDLVRHSWPSKMQRKKVSNVLS